MKIKVKKFFYYTDRGVYAHVCMCDDASVRVRGQLWRAGFLLLWVLGVELRLSGVVTRAFTC